MLTITGVPSIMTQKWTVPKHTCTSEMPVIVSNNLEHSRSYHTIERDTMLKPLRNTECFDKNSPKPAKEALAEGITFRNQLSLLWLVHKWLFHVIIVIMIWTVMPDKFIISCFYIGHYSNYCLNVKNHSLMKQQESEPEGTEAKTIDQLTKKWSKGWTAKVHRV